MAERFGATVGAMVVGVTWPLMEVSVEVLVTGGRQAPAWSRMCRLSWLVWPTLLAGCSTFTRVRSAEVSPGWTGDLAMTYAPPPGDAAAWFWSFDCSSDCDHDLLGGSIGVRRGFVSGDGGRAFEVGVGLSGTSPYVEGYAQLRRNRHPFGLGARLGVPIASWREDAFYARYDVVLGRSARILLNPALFRFSGGGSRGTRGSFNALAPGIGVKIGDDEGSSVILSLAYVHGRARRYPNLDFDAPQTSSFYVAGATVSFD